MQDNKHSGYNFNFIGCYQFTQNKCRKVRACILPSIWTVLLQSQLSFRRRALTARADLLPDPLTSSSSWRLSSRSLLKYTLIVNRRLKIGKDLEILIHAHTYMNTDQNLISIRNHFCKLYFRLLITDRIDIDLH